MDEDPLAAILGDKEELDDYESLPDLKKDDGASPGLLGPDLLAACKANDEGRTQDLLANGASPLYSDPESGWSCLHWSVFNGNPKLTRALVRMGAASEYKRKSKTLAQGRKAHKPNQPGRPAPISSLPMTGTPLHWSVFRGDLGITWILLKEGFSPNDTDNMGNTAAHLAAANGHERVLDTLIRDGADVHRQNKFKNTPYDVASSAGCRGILRRAEARPAPSAEKREEMHLENLQRILEVERMLIDVVAPLEPTDSESTRHKCQIQRQDGGDGKQDGDGDDGDDTAEEASEAKVARESKEEKGATEELDNTSKASVGGGGGGGGVDGGSVSAGKDGDSTTTDVAKDHDGNNDGADEKERGGDDHARGGSKGQGDDGVEGSVTSAGGETEGGKGGGTVGVTMQNHEADAKATGGRDGEDKNVAEAAEWEADSAGGGDGTGDPGQDILAQVKKIREAVTGAEAMCICEDLVAAAKLKIDALLLQHSIEKQTARVAAEAPILTQKSFTTLVNRLMLLLRRAEGNSRIPASLKRRAKSLVEKSHGEYWLQMTAQRLLAVECGEERHVLDMAKLELCIDKAAKVGAQAQLIRDCRSLLRRLKTEVEISKAILDFPTVRLPIDPLPKDYWQPEDNGHIEETEGFPLPPVDADGKSLDYVWVPSKSLRALSAACKRLSEALVGGEGLNPGLVERGSKKLQEVQKELKLLMEKDTADRDKAVTATTKAAKKKKKAGGGKKKKKKK